MELKLEKDLLLSREDIGYMIKTHSKNEGTPDLDVYPEFL